MRVKRICGICGKEFFVFPSRVKKGRGKYCGKECWRKSRIGKAYNVKQINLSPSSEVFYIMGVLKGDGNVYYRKKGSVIIGLTVTDEIFAMSFRNAMEKIGCHCWIRKIKTSNKPLWEVKSGSKMLGEFYRSFDIKSIPDNEEYKKAFVRGFYESEGSLWKRKDRKSYFLIAICNTDKLLLEIIYDYLINVGFNFRWRKLSKNKQFPNSKQAYQLYLQKKYEVIPFIKWLNPCIKNGGFNEFQMEMG